MSNLTVHVLTDEEFQGLVLDRQQALEREQRILELAERINQSYIYLTSGLQHFTREEVCGFLRCSVRMLYDYEKKGKLLPRRIGGKVLYPADQLLEFLKTYDQPDMAQLVKGRLSSFPTRKRKRTS